jgi:NADP-dependent 3-hydroxy acid dehydrogenase YdfG
MAKTIAVIGTGPGIGLHVAARFGREGFNAALIARNKENLEHYAGQLGDRGIEAAAFAADVTDRAGLADALARADEHFGSVDVIEYSPAGGAEMLATPRNITVENLLPQLDFTLGAVTAVQAVLPGMLQRGDGALLFGTAASAMEPVPFSANFGMAQAAIRNYTWSLHSDLKKEGIYAGILLVAGAVNKGDGSLDPPAVAAAAPDAPPPRMSVTTAYDIADMYWSLYERRDRIEVFAGDMELIRRLVSG